MRTPSEYVMVPLKAAEHECCGKLMVYRPHDRSYYCPHCQRVQPAPSLLPIELLENLKEY